ncbi:App1 family protein [Winogradskyella sp. UBA3174]|uniref:App1 family protein n=1 Tax=Winogradskyella sp. UBA3174 TaxID=1947785 RepID=UPI0025F093D4|nr:phosphatase domain-containing protein [Winogradskyella sp. UBA3174]
MSWFNKDPLQIITFKTYGTASHLYLKGRALEDEDIDLEKKSWFSLLVNSWKRFETDEIRNTPLKITLPNGKIIESSTDAEGYYLIDESTENTIEHIDTEGWLAYEVAYTSTRDSRKIQLKNCFLGQMLIPKIDSSFGVISDIDDTILHTGVASTLKWRVIVNTFFKTPHKRKALEGSAEFYHALHNGKSCTEANPIFYVSNSPWNLYRYLEFFLKMNNFPKGPILLRDLRTPFDRTPRSELAHKYHEIYNILNTYVDLKFILIGDCGEKDAYIYLDVVKAFPNRIAAIYLRSVDHSRKMKKISNLFENYKAVPVRIVQTSDEAIKHAKKHKFIA